MAAAVTAMLGAVALVLAACSGGGGGGDAGSLTTAEITATLARHAHGVLSHDRSAFLAGVDPAAKASAFRSAQQAQYDNLVQVPLSSWSYTIGAAVTDRTAQAAARTTWGSSARIVRVELHYALRGIDRVPVQHDLWWTFVRSGGHVVVAADNGLATAGGVSWTGPWDFGPMAVVAGRTDVVFGLADQTAQLRGIAAAVDTAIPSVTAVWGTAWTRRVAVLVPPTPAALAAALGGPSTQAPTDVSALAVSAGQDPLTSAELEQRLVVDPAPYARLSAIGQRITLTHEITHLASAAATTEASPRWLVEGLAEYVGNLGTGQPVPVAASELAAQVRRGQLPTTLPTDADVDGASAATAYESSWLACRLIAATAGQAGLVRFYRTVGASPSDSDTAVASALGQVVHESVATFTARWRSYLTAQLR